MRWGAVALAVGVLAGAALGAVGLARCGGARTRGASEVRLHLEADPPHLNPLVAADLVAVRVTLGDVYEPLWSVKPDRSADGGSSRPPLVREIAADDTLAPELAESWWRSPDDRDWIVTLRERTRWHDERPFTSADVVFTFRLLAPGGAATPLAADFDDLELVEAQGPRTVHFRWKAYRVGRDRAVARVAILPAHVFGTLPVAELARHPANASPVGTGPYRLASWEAGRSITLARWTGHRAPAAIARVVYRIIPDRAQAVAQLRAGQLDAMMQAPGSELEAFAADARFVVAPWDAETFTAVSWNCRGGALADPRVRRALTMLLDRETIVREIYKGRGRLLSGPWLPDAPAYDASVAPWPFDVEGARRLLAEAGVASPRVKLLLPQESRVLERIATIWQEDARRAGVTIEVESAPWGEVLRRARAAEFDGVAFSWTTAPEQDFYHRFHSSQTDGDNWGGVADAELDRLLAAIRTSADRPARLELEHALHRRLHELAPVTFVSADVRAGVFTRRLRGVRIGADGMPARLMSFEEGR